MIASSVMIAIVWLGSEIIVIHYQRVGARDFSEESWEQFKKSQLHIMAPERDNIFATSLTLVGILMAIPYGLAVICFFLGVIKIANNITCMFACT